MRSYAGTPIVLANGYRVGVLCMLDLQPKVLDAAATRLLVNVAGLVARELEGLAGSDYQIPANPRVASSSTSMLTMAPPPLPPSAFCSSQLSHLACTVFVC